MGQEKFELAVLPLNNCISKPGLKLPARRAFRSTCNLHPTRTHKFGARTRSETHPKYRRGHIQGLRGGGELGGAGRCVASAWFQSGAVFDSGHTASFLARGSRHYLVVESEFFQVQLARTRSQSGLRVRGRGLATANEQAERRQKRRKPRRQSSVVHPLFRLSCCHRRRDLGFFFLCIRLFLCNPREDSMSPFIAELSSRDSNSRGKRFSHSQAVADCVAALTGSARRVPTTRLRAARHREAAADAAAGPAGAAGETAALPLCFSVLTRTKGLKRVESTHLDVLYLQPHCARACASAPSRRALPLDPPLSLGECR